MSRFQIVAPLNNDILPSIQQIEVASTLQIPAFHIVGLPGPEVSEARERVRAAIDSSGLQFPRRRIVLNLSPASIRKQGTGLDLAMALAILSASLPNKNNNEDDRIFCAAWGELGLNGTVKPVGQILRSIYSAWKAGIPFLFLSESELNDGKRARSLIQEAESFPSQPPQLIPVSCLREAWDIFLGLPQRTVTDDSITIPEPVEESSPVSLLPLSPSMERIIGIAAAGNHHLLVLGPKGAGKTHAMEWLTALQPPLEPRYRLMQALMQELSTQKKWLCALQARRVGAQTRPAALIGSASSTITGGIRPGEFSLAHGGLLIADELPEWARDSCEALREPLERGTITLTRSRGTVELPARFTFAATGNFCPCGGIPPQYGSITSSGNAVETELRRCSCTSMARTQYLSKLSGPIMDRIDLVLKVGYSSRTSVHSAEARLLQLRKQVLQTREHAKRLWGNSPGLLSASQLENLLSHHQEWLQAPPLHEAGSLRNRHKVLRIALSLAAWDQLSEPTSAHFMEAVCYRPEQLFFTR